MSNWISSAVKTRGRVFIIILNWNGWKDTIDCVLSCLRLTYPDFHILVVDNGSTDGSERILRGRLHGVEIIQTGSNLGFAGGNNVGIKYALERGAEHIWLLNNDTVVDGSALEALVRGLEGNAGAGIAVSKIYYSSGRNTLWFAGGIWSPDRNIAQHRGLDEEDTGQYDALRESDFATGCSLLFHAGLVAEIGLLKEDYFLYWEDVDWSVTARERGWKVIYVPGSRVWHKVSTSVQDQSFVQAYYYFRSGLLFYRRHAPGALLRFAANHLAYACNQRLRGRRNVVSGYAAGLRDFVLGRFGKRIE